MNNLTKSQLEDIQENIRISIKKLETDCEFSASPYNFNFDKMTFDIDFWSHETGEFSFEIESVELSKYFKYIDNNGNIK